MKIRKKASLLFVSLFVTAFLIVGVIILMFGKDNLTRIISNNLKSISSIQLNRIESIDSQNLERLNLISSRTQLRISLNDYNENPQEMLQQKMNAILDDAKLSVSDFDQISIINLNGKIVASTDKTIIGENADINDSVFILSQKQNITNIYKLDETGDLKIYMYGPLVYNDKTLGVVTVIASSVKIQNFLSDYSGLGKSGYTSVVFIDNYSDKNPIISPERFDSVFRYKQVNYSELSQISKRILDKKTGVFQNILDEKKELVFASIEYSENLNLGLSVRISKAEVLTPLRRLLLLLTIVMMGMIIILVFAINYSTKLISKPIESLTERTSRISKGNFDEKIEIESKDEIGLLAKSFNIMLANLRQSESRWQFALESSGDGVWDWNAQSNEVFFSKRWKEMLGYKEDEIANNFEEWDMLLHPDDKERSYLELNKHFEGKTEIFQLESRLKCKDGTYKWILLRGKIIERTEDNKPLRIIGTHIDLTERKKAEKLLHEREAYSKALFEYAAVPIWVEDFSEVKKYFNKLKEKGVNDFSIYFHENLEEVKHIASLVEVTEINQKNLELYGVTSKEELLSTLANWFNEESWLVFRDEQIALAEGKSQFESEISIVTPQGEIKQLILYLAVHPDYLDTLKIVFVSFIDITDRKKAEKELIHSHNLMHYIIEHNQSDVAVHDKDLKYIFVSQSYLDHYNVKEKDVIGKHHYDVFPDLPQKWRDVHQKALAGEISRADEDPYEREDGSVDWTRWECRPWHEADGSIGGIIVYTEVITKQKQIEKELSKHRLHLEKLVKERTASLAKSQNALLNLVDDVNSQSTKLEKSNAQFAAINQELETFTYSVSHDLKAPLRGIDGYSQLLHDTYFDELNEEARGFITNIRYSTQQMNTLIEDLLVYSRMERQAFRNENVHFKALMDNLFLFYSKTISENKIDVKLDIPEIFIPKGDKDGLNLVMRNLIDNAIKFSSHNKKAQIEIGCSESDAQWLIFVKDNGVGFDMKYHDKIFKIFNRLHLAEEYEGTGIGLAMVSKAMQRMKGKIWAESEVGKGATFYLEIKKT